MWRRFGVPGGCEEVRPRTGENDLDASRLVRPNPGVPLVARLSGSVSGRETTTRLCVNTRISTRDIGRRTLGLVLLLQQSFVACLKAKNFFLLVSKDFHVLAIPILQGHTKIMILCVEIVPLLDDLIPLLDHLVQLLLASVVKVQQLAIVLFKGRHSDLPSL